MAQPGDVFSLIAALIGIGISIWALLVTAALLFTERTDLARGTIEARPWKPFGIGVAILLPLGVFSTAAMKGPDPGGKTLGMLIALALLSLAAVGLSGLAQLVGQRMQPNEASPSTFRSTARGAAVLIGACLVPAVGWWVFIPAVLSISIGSGVMSLMRRRSASIEAV